MRPYEASYTFRTYSRRLTGCLLSLSLAAAALGEAPVHYKSIVVRFFVANDGALHITETAELEVPDGVTMAERSYWSEGEQQVTFDRVARVEGEQRIEERFESPWSGEVKWKVSPGTATYVLESTVADAAIPAWSLPRGRLTRDSTGLLADPKLRAREIGTLWAEAARKPRSRYMVDYQYQMPPVSEQGTDIQLQLDWGGQWEPVQTITGDTIAKKIEPDFYDPTRWRVTHLFDYGGAGFPAAVDMRRHLLRAAAIAGFPIACLILWLFFFLRELLRRGFRSGLEMEDHALQQTVYDEAPEVIAAQWTGEASPPRIEAFLRRLEKRGKLAIGVTDRGEEEDPLVALRLLAPREELTPYERAGIDALMPHGWETSSDEVIARHGPREADDSFDPTSALQDSLAGMAAEYGRKAKAKVPWYSKLTSFALFAGGVFLLIQETVRYHREPVLFFAALFFCAALSGMWPDSLAHNAIRNRLRWSLALLLPALIATAAIAFACVILEQPPGVYAAAGLALILLGTYKAILAASATREPPAVRQRLADLARARDWFRAELRQEHPRLRDDAIPWLESLGLQRDLHRWRRRHIAAPSRFVTGGWTGNPPPSNDENWGESLVA